MMEEKDLTLFLINVNHRGQLKNNLYHKKG